MAWDKICARWGCMTWGEVFDLRKKVKQDFNRAKKAVRKKFLNKLVITLSETLWTDAETAKQKLNDCWAMFCRAYECDRCPISEKCKEVFAAIEG